MSARKALLEDLLQARKGNPPGKVTEVVHRSIVDTLGVIGWGRRSSRYQLFERSTGLVADAVIRKAMLGAYAAQTDELDDGHRFSGSHPGAVVVPCVISAALERGLTSDEIIKAAAVGYEVMLYIGATVHPELTRRGLAPTGTCGSAGVAAALGHIEGLTPEELASAVGHALAYAPLSLAASFRTAESKPAHAAAAVLSGAFALDLAKAGVPAEPGILDAAGGFQLATSGRAVSASIDRWRSEEVYLKPYPACRHSHASLDCVAEILRGSGRPTADVRSISVLTYGLAVEILTATPVGPGSSTSAAQFNLPFLVASLWIHGKLLPERIAADLEDPRIERVMKLVAVSEDDDLTSRYPEETGARVEVTWSDGATGSAKVEIPRGDPRRPMLQSEVLQKLERLNPGSEGESLWNALLPGAGRSWSSHPLCQWS